MPWGRGGAGNFEAATIAAANQKASEDIEAQRPKVEDVSRRQSQQPPTSPTTTTAQPSNLNQDYAHMGRGGAGNWYTPKELAQTGEFVTSPEQPATSEAQSANRETVLDSRPRGRGGAGNFVWTAEHEEKAGRQKEEMEIELKEMVAKDVEKGLPKPDRAFIRQWDE